MKLENITKNFIKNGKKIEVLKNLNMKFEKGKMYLIKGRSGCGKSTLINILGLIDSFDSGKYTLDDKIMNNLNDNNLTQLRKEKIGMIFQNHYLDPRLTAKENIKIATFLNNLTEEENELNMQKLFQVLI